MDLLLYIGIFIAALATLLKASNWFVDSAESIGLSMGISPFIIGVTIVAFGTSLPELATSIASVFAGQSEIVVGNVIGSNITNIALVLGLTAIVVKNIHLDNDLWLIDMSFLWASAFMLWFVLADSHLSTFECILLILALILFLTYSFKGNERADSDDRPKALPKHYLLLVLGGVLVYFGAEYTIYAITQISTILTIPPKLIALSAVAIGTSLPEVVVSLTAARRGKASIAIGNVLGSNIFNTFIVMAVPGLIGNLEIPADIISFYLPLMIVMTILFGVMAFDRLITRWEGWILLLFYLLFMGQIVQS
ncbi:MAG: calcium/sodium antiporter [Lewinella sp.]|jgi:cation:H+ antiporter|uniref:calcium/sodium antiporter n=1 Tax=Lewinella sp. TaxID=2004506 RepID=UPI003D6B289C